VTRIGFALLLTLALALAGAGTSAGRQETPSPTVIRGKEKWVSVGQLRGAPLQLDAEKQRRITVGAFTFPEGRLPRHGKRTYEGITIATVRIRPTSEVKTGIDYLWSDVGGWPYALFEVKRTKKRSCPNAVKWSAGGIINGPQGGVDCDGVIRFRTVNELPYASVRTGPKNWTFSLESLGRHLIDSATVSTRSKVGITRLTPSYVKLLAPKTFDLPDGEESSVPVTIENRGGRVARGLGVGSWVDDDERWVACQRSRKLNPLAPGKSRKVRIPVAGLPDGQYILYLTAGGKNGYGDTISYRYVVGPETVRISAR